MAEVAGPRASWDNGTVGYVLFYDDVTFAPTRIETFNTTGAPAPVEVTVSTADRSRTFSRSIPVGSVSVAVPTNVRNRITIGSETEDAVIVMRRT